jgi:hypothetical protein
MFRLLFTSVVLVALISAQSSGALVLTQYDAAAAQVYANGGGTGFGGTLGGGAVTMDIVGSNLVVGFVQGNPLNDLVALFLDTRGGGFVDAQMDDQADGGRRALSNLTAGDNDVYPTGMAPPDFGVIFGNFGTVLFELTPGNTPGHLNFLNFTNVVGAMTIPLATLSNPGQIDFFAGYIGDSGYGSNESLPYSLPLNSAGNPGFGSGATNVYENFNRFVTSPVPEPSMILVWGLVLITAGFAGKKLRQE